MGRQWHTYHPHHNRYHNYRTPISHHATTRIVDRHRPFGYTQKAHDGALFVWYNFIEYEDCTFLRIMRITARCRLLARGQVLLQYTLLTCLGSKADRRAPTGAKAHIRSTINCGVTMKTGYRNGRHGKSFTFNYRRNIPPLPAVHVPRIVFPKKLPCHTRLEITADRPQDSFFLMQIIWMRSCKKYIAIHRKVS